MANVEDVVWAKTQSGYPKWPCKVIEVTNEMEYTIQSFGDHIEYKRKKKDLSMFSIEATLLAEGRKYLKNKQQTLQAFESAVKDAVNHIQTTIDPNFQLPEPGTKTPTPYSTHSATPSNALPANIVSTPLNNTKHKRKRLRSNSSDESNDCNPSDMTHQLKRECPSTELSDVSQSLAVNIQDNKDNDSNFVLSDGAPVSPILQKRPSPQLELSTSPVPEFDPTEQDSPLLQIDSSDSNDSDDDLPSVSFTDQKWSIADSKPNDIIWAKYEKYPHWPALVDSINTKKKKIKLFFFGWPDEYSISMSYNNKKKFVAYNYQNTEKFKNEGLYKLANETYLLPCFNQAMKEVETLRQLRASNSVESAPKDQFIEISQRRPSEFRKLVSTMSSRKQLSLKPHNEETPSKSPEEMSDVQKELFGGNDDESDDNGDVVDIDEDNEDTRLPYCYANVNEQFNKLQPVLESICRGEIYSNFHQKYIATSKERSTMKNQAKFGPANNIPTPKKSELIEFLQRIIQNVTGDRANFSYAFDVLLPEAMARTISNIEACTIEEAWKRLGY